MQVGECTLQARGKGLVVGLSTGSHAVGDAVFADPDLQRDLARRLLGIGLGAKALANRKAGGGDDVGVVQKTPHFVFARR